MKALVTGGTGFVGGHLIDALLQAGDSVTALVRSPAKAAGLAERGVRVLAGDLTDAAALRAAAQDQEVIYHAAGLVAARDEAGFLSVNREGTAKLLDAAAQVSRARFVLISSLAAVGPAQRGERLRGDEPTRPLTAYGRSKLAGEEIVRAGALPWTIVRPPAVYGPRDAEFLRVYKAVRLGILPVFGDGTQQLSLVYAPDLAEALVAVGRRSDLGGRVFHPAHPEVLTTTELAGTIARAIGRSVRVVGLPRWFANGALAAAAGAARLTGRTTLLTPDKALEFFAPAWTADPGPLEREVGWQAAHDFTAGSKATATWYRKAGWL